MDADVRKFLPAYIQAGLILDQGIEGACTGFGLAAVVNYLLWHRGQKASPSAKIKFKSVSPHMLYDLARFYDEWPGQDYEGSSCRGAMKGWHKHGVCVNSLWPQSVNPAAAASSDSTPQKSGKATAKRSKSRAVTVAAAYRPDGRWAADAATRPVGVYYRVDHRSVTDMQAAVYDVGAIYVSCNVHAGWDNLKTVSLSSKTVSHAGLPRIEYDDGVEPIGGHAFAIVGFNADGFVIQNSWGTGWGLGGFAVLSYADWVANGSDAWVCALGVAQSKPVGAQRALGNPTRLSDNRALLTGDIKLTPKPINPYAATWETSKAYFHSVVAGNDGIVDSSCPDIPNAADYVNRVIVEGFETWITSEPKGTPRLVIYAHGGLNPLKDGIVRARVLGPYFANNGIYPVFYSWKTGFLETVKQSLQDAAAAPEQPDRMATGFFADARDRLIESVCNGPLRWAWRQMKQNAEAATQPDRAIALMVTAIAILKEKYPKLEVHVVGHSAGSFVAGHALSLGLPVTSLALYAPACSLSFALASITPHAPVDRTYLYLLKDAVEKADYVGSKAVYAKSLLWLVSRGFEDKRKTPLAGFARALDGSVKTTDNDLWDEVFSGDLAAWRAWVTTLISRDGSNAVNVVASHKVTLLGQDVPGAHGGFDNDIDVIEATINRMLGQAPGSVLKVPVEDLRY